MEPGNVSGGYPGLTPDTARRVDVLFAPENRRAAAVLLAEHCGTNLPFPQTASTHQLERFRFAALRLSDGDPGKLQRAVKLAQKDWRDLLVAADFADDVEAHRKWEPKPWNEPAEVNPSTLGDAIHDRLGAMLGPLGFARIGEEWRRGGEVPQAVRVVAGWNDRVEARFTLRVMLQANPRGVLLILPKLSPSIWQGGRGYIFRSGVNSAAVLAEMEKDLAKYAMPWFQRFTTRDEFKKGVDSGEFKPNLPMGDNMLLF